VNSVDWETTGAHQGLVMDLFADDSMCRCYYTGKCERISCRYRWRFDALRVRVSIVNVIHASRARWRRLVIVLQSISMLMGRDRCWPI
jgi:hypothetical protein